MSLSRRRFVRALGVSGGAALLPFQAPRAQAATAAAPAPTTGPAAEPIRLNSNECPFPPPPAVQKAVAEATLQGHRYPRNASALVDALARQQGVAPDNVLLGLGSGELLQAAPLAFCGPGRALVAPVPTFETPITVARRLNLPVREVALDAELRVDLAALEDASAGAGLLFLCNPNNPTGTLVPTRDVSALIDRLRDRSPETVVLLDEAYFDFVESPGYASLAARAARERRLVVTRTFSKAYGLAGLRMGYAIGHKDTLGALRQSMTSGMLPVTSVAAALAALADEASMRKNVAQNAQARAGLRRFFEAQGLKVVDSHTNFLLVEVKRDARAFQETCRERGLLVGRPFPPLGQHSRISIGTPAEMERALPLLQAVLKG
jgi:histidinol-phosphate aminotransferase